MVNKAGMKNFPVSGLLRLRHFARCILVILICFVFIQGSDSEEPEKTFCFVFMTDIHLQPELKGDEGFKTAIAQVNKLKPDFVITGGDLIKDALEQSFERSAQLYDLYDQICRDFEMPVYNTMGNHEVFGLYEISGVSPDHPDYGKEMYKKRLGNNRTYYSFEYKGWHFIITDAIGFTADREYFGEVDSVQMEWIRNDLQKIDEETPIIISTHIPFLSVSEQVACGGTAALLPYLVVGNSNEVLSLFDKYNLQLVLQGHLHIVEEIIFRDIHFITGGAVCGAWWEGPYSGFPEGFVVVNIYDDSSFDWRYETYGWEAVRTDE